MTDVTPLHGEDYDKRIDVLIQRIKGAIDESTKERPIAYVILLGALDVVKNDLFDEFRERREDI